VSAATKGNPIPLSRNMMLLALKVQAHNLWDWGKRRAAAACLGKGKDSINKVCGRTHFDAAIVVQYCIQAMSKDVLCELLQ
jgi:hypothetical protein